MALRVLKGGLMTSLRYIEICINILSLCILQQKTRNPKSEYFFIANYMTSRVFRAVFPKRRAAARYRAATTPLPCCEVTVLHGSKYKAKIDLVLRTIVLQTKTRFVT